MEIKPEAGDERLNQLNTLRDKVKLSSPLAGASKQVAINQIQPSKQRKEAKLIAKLQFKLTTNSISYMKRVKI